MLIEKLVEILAFLIPINMYKQSVINLVGTIPDNVIPSISETQAKGIDAVFIYFRSDDNLYLYDTKLNTEFDLFNMIIPT